MTHITASRTVTTSRFASRLEATLHYSLGIVVALAAGAGIARLTDTGIPSCGSSRVDRTLRTIVRDGFAGAAISGKAEVSRAGGEARCTATLTAQDGSRREMTYRVFRNEAGRLRVSAAW